MTISMHATKQFGAGLLIACLLACGGGSHDSTPTPAPQPVAATGLVYNDPPDTKGWRLVKSAESKPSHLILELRAPDAAAGLGVGFVLTGDAARIKWAKVAAADADYAHNLAFDLGKDPATSLSKGLVKGNDLQIGIYQKGIDHLVTYSGPVLSLALELKPAATVLTGTSIPLSLTKFRHINKAGDAEDLKSSVAIGTLIAQ